MRYECSRKGGAGPFVGSRLAPTLQLAVLWVLALLLLITAALPAQAQVPVVAMDEAMGVSATNAFVTGSVNPNGQNTVCFVQWGTGAIYTHQSYPFLSIPAQNSEVPVQIEMKGLAPGTSYRYRLAATNVSGAGYSAERTLTTLTTPLALPIATTGAADVITTNSARVYGSLDPNGLVTSFYFQWGVTTSYGNVSPIPPFLPTGSPFNNIATTLTNLTPGTIYHYRFVATNTAGMAYGMDRTFTTLSTYSTGEHAFTWSTNDGTLTIVSYSGPGGMVAVPASIHGIPVTALDAYAFERVTNLTAVVLPGSLLSLGSMAFFGCTALTQIDLPSSVREIGWGCFANCTSLENISLPPEVRELPDSIFSQCTGLTNVNLGAGLVSVAGRAFAGCTGLPSVTFPTATVSIDLSAFTECTQLAAIEVDPLNPVYRSVDGVLLDKKGTTLILYPPGKVTHNYYLPNSVVIVGPRAFYGLSNITGVTFGDRLASISDQAFLGCYRLGSLHFPHSLTNIQDGQTASKGGPIGAFTWCNGLTNVTFGKGLSYIGLGAFNWCTNLTAVYFHGNAPVPGTDFTGPDILRGTPATVYYLPGTTGWQATYAERPALLWNPAIQTADSSFGIRDGNFGFRIAGTPGIPVVIEASDRVASGSGWSPRQTCLLTNGLVEFRESMATNGPAGVYRIRSP